MAHHKAGFWNGGVVTRARFQEPLVFLRVYVHAGMLCPYARVVVGHQFEMHVACLA